MYELDRKFFNSDWLETDPSSKRFIQNKPDIVDPDDPRLSNSREWIAPTVTLEEAIAGISNERRAFTPFRARNAIESIAVPRSGGSFTGAVNFDSLVTITSVDFANSDNNILIGNGVLVNNTNGEKNTGIGFQALASNTQGSLNTAYGFNSLLSNTTGILNTGLGSRSLSNNTTGESNTAVGDLSLSRNTIGSKNVSQGYRSLFANTEGSKNTAIGTEAGHFVEGSSNVFIGHRAGFNATGDDNLYIANTATLNPLILGNFSTEELQINGSLAVSSDLDVVGISEFTTVDVDNIQNVRSISYDTEISSNLPLGRDALISTTDGDKNTALGNFTLTSNTTGSSNTAVGLLSLNKNTTGEFNCAVGNNALSANVDGNSNSAFGAGALGANTRGDLNSAFGVNSLSSNTAGNFNCGFGNNALSDNTTGISNSALGVNALLANTTGGSNAAFGRSTLIKNTRGSNNTAFGTNALSENTTGSRNAVLGKDALMANRTGVNNTAVGMQAGQNSLGISNVFIGYKAGANATGSNRLYISNSSTNSPLVFGNFSSRELQINGSLAVTNGLEIIGIVEAEDIQANVIQGDRFNTTEIIVDDDLVDITTPANGGAFVLMYTGANNEPEPQVESSAMVYYNVGNNPALRSSDAGDGVTVVNNNNPNSIVPNTIVIGVDQGIIRIRSTWDDPIVIRMTFIV